MDKKKRDQINDCLKGVKRGERDALVSLYDLISPTLRFIALKYLKNEQDAEDLEQDFWAHISTIASKSSCLQGAYSYLCKVMTNMAINRYKKLSGTKDVCIDSVDYLKVCSYDDSDCADMRMTVQNAINSLDKDEQIVVQLGVFEDKTIHQIAKELNMSKSAVGRLKLSAQDKLKKMLEKEVMFVENWDISAKSDETRENNPVEIV